MLGLAMMRKEEEEESIQESYGYTAATTAAHTFAFASIRQPCPGIYLEYSIPWPTRDTPYDFPSWNRSSNTFDLFAA